MTSLPADAAAAQAEYAQGLAQVTRALELARELGNPYDEAQCLGQTGTMLRLLHSHDEADNVLKQTVELGRALNEPHVQAEALMERGSLLLADGRLTEAQQSLTEAIVLARRIAARSVLAEACKVVVARARESRRPRVGAGAVQGISCGARSGARRVAQACGERRSALARLPGCDRARASQYRERAERLAADHAALTRKAKVLTEVSQQDPLTGLLNRRGLDAHIEALVAASEANDVPLTLALIDIDLFKRINDMFSHAVGDTVLRRVAA